jgi:hypothetical protein
MGICLELLGQCLVCGVDVASAKGIVSKIEELRFTPVQYVVQKVITLVPTDFRAGDRVGGSLGFGYFEKIASPEGVAGVQIEQTEYGRCNVELARHHVADSRRDIARCVMLGPIAERVTRSGMVGDEDEDCVLEVALLAGEIEEQLESRTGIGEGVTKEMLLIPTGIRRGTATRNDKGG